MTPEEVEADVAINEVQQSAKEEQEHASLHSVLTRQVLLSSLAIVALAFVAAVAGAMALGFSSGGATRYALETQIDTYLTTSLRETAE